MAGHPRRRLGRVLLCLLGGVVGWWLPGWVLANPAIIPVAEQPWFRLSAHFGSPPDLAALLAPEERVALVEERLEITLAPPQATVVATLLLRNLAGDPVRLELGFPAAGYPLADGHSLPALHEFAVEADGQPVATRAGITEGQRWELWELTLPPDRPLLLGVRYRTDADDRFDYILTTGAGWRGPLGRLLITVRASPGQQLPTFEQVAPDGGCWREGALHWDLGPLEPWQDLRLCWRECEGARQHDHEASHRLGRSGLRLPRCVGP